MRVFWLLVFALGLTLMFPALSMAQTPESRGDTPRPEAVAEAKELFRAGSRAYDAGQFAAAVQAFDQAYELTHKPPLRFSAAQSLRRQYTKDQDPALLRKAQRYYREYIEATKTGGRVKDATEALGEIEVLLARHPEPVAPDGEQPPEVVPPVKTTGTLHVNSAVKGATAVIAGRPPIEDLPQWIELPPGEYRVTISAKGFIPAKRTVRIIAARLTPFDPTLREKPARLTIETDGGADILIDGKPVGRAPLPEAVELPSGTHRVAVGRAGHDVFTTTVKLKRGERKTLDAHEGMTTQRIFAWVVLGGAAVTLSAGIVLAFGAAAQQRDAVAIDDIPEAEQRALTPEEADDYNAKLSTRDNFVRFAAGAFALGGIAAGAGLLLFVLDEPNLYATTSPEKDGALLIVGGRF